MLISRESSWCSKLKIGPQSAIFSGVPQQFSARVLLLPLPRPWRSMTSQAIGLYRNLRQTRGHYLHVQHSTKLLHFIKLALWAKQTSGCLFMRIIGTRVGIIGRRALYLTSYKQALVELSHQRPVMWWRGPIKPYPCMKKIILSKYY
mgnify:CR=1 FL=1